MEEGNFTTTTTEVPVQISSDLNFLIIPLVVIVIVMILSACVYLMAKRRRMYLLQENIMSLYDFDHNEEWDSIDSYDHPSYNSMAHTTTV